MFHSVDNDFERVIKNKLIGQCERKEYPKLILKQ